MCSGIAVAYSDLPIGLISAHGLDCLVHDRGGEKEVQFLHRISGPVLPVWHAGELRIVRWGSRSLAKPELGGGWIGRDAVPDLAATLIDIPATLGLTNGIWFRITQGIRGVLLDDPDGPVAYMLVEPSSHYYQTMTKSRQMPVLIGERI